MKNIDKLVNNITSENIEIERNIKHALCCQALQRALGELRAAQETMWRLDNGKFPLIYYEIENFIKISDRFM